MTTKRKPRSVKGFARYAAELGLEKKAKNILMMDLRTITDMTDYFVICSADSDTQLRAIADNIVDGMNKYDQKPYKTEGWTAARWVILDFVEFVVHIFHHETREFYKIERLWSDAKTERIADTETA